MTKFVQETARIADEFGESFADVIMGLREQGCNWHTVAGAVEVPFVTLRKWTKKLGLWDDKRNYEIIPPKPLDVKAQALGYSSAEAMLVEWRMDGKTRREIAETLGCHPTSLYWHTPEEVKALPIITEKQREARRKSAERLNRRRDGADRTYHSRTES